jgi:CTP:molybdopterin cytidylyltransferase MocA
MLKVAAVLLAAGASTRFGPENKLVAAIDGRPLVRIVADTLVAAAERGDARINLALSTSNEWVDAF